MSNHLGLSDSVLTTLEISGRSAAAAANGTALDMKGWDAVRFVITIGTMGVNSTVDGLVQSAADSGMNTATTVNIANAALVQIPAANANCIAIVEVYRPTNRYVRFQATTAVNAVVYSVIADQFRRGGILPPTQAAQQVVRVAQN